MVKLCAVLVFAACVNFSAAYFGQPVGFKAKQAETVSSSIRAVVEKIGIYKAFFYLANTIDKDDSQTGSTIYLKILALVDSYTETIAEFLNSLSESAQAENLSPSVIIANTEKLITQLIEKETIKQQINDAIVSGGPRWFFYLPKFGSISDQISNDLKTIFGALIVICDTHRTSEEVDSADQKMILKLQDLLTQMTNLNVFYAKIKEIDDFIKQKVEDFTQARISFENIFDNQLVDYNDLLKAAENAIASRNLLHSKAFKTGMLEKSGTLDVDYDPLDGNLIIDGSKFDFKSKYLKPIQLSPTYLKNEIDKLLSLINENINEVPDHIQLTRKVLIKLLYNTAKNQDIVETYDCIMSTLIEDQYNKLIADSLTGLRTVASYSYFAVVPFSRKILFDFYAIVSQIIAAIKPQATKTEAKLAFETVSSKHLRELNLHNLSFLSDRFTRQSKNKCQITQPKMNT